MNPNNEDQEFAESAKNEIYYDNAPLNTATHAMFKILDEAPPKADPVKRGLAQLLREVQTQQLFAGERDENGKQLLKSFEHWVKSARRFYVHRAGGSKGDKYKHVTEALTYNRLEDAKLSPLPDKRSVLHKVSSVELELQVIAWEQTLKDTGGKNITPMHVAKAAIAVGSKCVTIPPLTASSKMPEIRQEWAATKSDLVKDFGQGAERHFTRLDALLLKKERSAEAGALIGANPLQSAQEANQSQGVTVQARATLSAAPGAEGTTLSKTTIPSGENAKGGNSPIVATSSFDQILDRVVGTAASAAEAAVQEGIPAPGAAPTNTEATADIVPKQVVTNFLKALAAESPPPDDAKVPQHDAFILDCSNSQFDRMRTSPRPWVTAFAGKVLIGFESSEHFQRRVKAGFPHPKPIYTWKGDKFGGVWEHQSNLDDGQQLTEIQRVAELLAKTQPASMDLPKEKTA